MSDKPLNFNHLPFGLLIVQNGVVSLINTEAAEILDSTGQELVGSELVDLISVDFQNTFKELLEKSLNGPKAAHVRLKKNLKAIEFTVNDSPQGHVICVRDASLEFYYSSMACQDLTHDIQTGLPDHYHILTEVRNRLNSSTPNPHTIICLWVDDLVAETDSEERKVNRIMNDLAVRFQDKLRGPDMLARLHENGFMVAITKELPDEDVEAIKNRLKDEASFPVQVGTELHSYTASFASGVVRKPTISEALDKIGECSQSIQAEKGQGLVRVINF